MLSNTLVRKNKIYSICVRSGNIQAGETFNGICLADTDSFSSVIEDAPVVCCGQIKDDELLFRTIGGRYYFSLRDGWGYEDGTLYGLSRGLFFDFKHPTYDETILSECEANLGTYHTWGGAMAYQARKHTLDTIAAILKKAAQL